MLSRSDYHRNFCVSKFNLSYLGWADPSEKRDLSPAHLQSHPTPPINFKA